MIIRELNIRGFGALQNRRFVFGDRLNILYGGNEAGKSTLHLFLRAMFYGLERARGRAAKTDAYALYEPWFGDGAYGGSLRFEEGGNLYRIERDFRKSPTDLSIIDESAGLPIEDPEIFLRTCLCGLSQTAYMNTVSIRQLRSATDAGMTQELKNYIANMNATGEHTLNIDRATAYLRDQRKAFEQRLVPDAAKHYAANVSEIRKLEEQIAAPGYRNTLQSLSASKQDSKTIQETLLAEKEKRIQALAAKRQILEERGFRSRRDLPDLRNRLNAWQQERTALRSKNSLRAQLITAFLLIPLALLLYFTMRRVVPDSANKLQALLCITAVGCIALGLCLFFSVLCGNRRRMRSNRNIRQLVQAHFPELLLDKELARRPASLAKAGSEKIDELLLVQDEIQRSESDVYDIEEKLRLLKTRQEETEASMANQQKSQWLLEQQLQHLSSLKDETAALKSVVAENDRLNTEIEAINIALETLVRLSETIHDSFGRYLNQSASQLISGITGNVYDSLSVDQNLNVFLNTSRKLIPLEQAGAGTVDQVYFALRLAAADLLQFGGNSLPLFLDDSFANYDDQRLRTVLHWMLETYASRQILLFTPRLREAQLLTASMLPFHLVEL